MEPSMEIALAGQASQVDSILDVALVEKRSAQLAELAFVCCNMPPGFLTALAQDDLALCLAETIILFVEELLQSGCSSSGLAQGVQKLLDSIDSAYPDYESVPGDRIQIAGLE